MELVLLGDIQNGFASNWAKIANTEGVAGIKIGDRFREQGFGQGAEELEVAGVDISPIGGASRLFFNRAANATQPEVHRLGAVLLPVGGLARQVDPAYQPLRETIANGSASAQEVMPHRKADVSAVQPDMTAGAQSSSEAPALVPLKRGRGRPKGSKNVRKEEVAFPTGF